GTVGLSLDESVTERDVQAVMDVFGDGTPLSIDFSTVDMSRGSSKSPIENRESAYLTHPIFNTHHSETELLRYIFKLQSRDLSLAYGMIPLGSCTMKLNATSEMLPVTWPEFGALHPYAPAEQTAGYQKLFADLEKWLAEITGFDAISLQPNAGSQGEYAGLLAIRA